MSAAEAAGTVAAASAADLYPNLALQFISAITFSAAEAAATVPAASAADLYPNLAFQFISAITFSAAEAAATVCGFSGNIPLIHFKKMCTFPFHTPISGPRISTFGL